MVKRFYFFLTLLFFCCNIFPNIFDPIAEKQKIVVTKKRILFPQFPGAHNPSILHFDGRYLLTFRYCPDLYSQLHISHIGAVLLNEAFDPISEPQLLSTRLKNSKTPSQSEDGRLFIYKGRTFLIYNDNIDVAAPSVYHRRDMFISELTFADNHFNLSPPLKLFYKDKFHVLWQKNWIPFEWNGKLLLSYTLNPHEVIYANLMNGECYSCYETSADIHWRLGSLRGSSSPQLLDGEYFGLFHSAAYLPSPSTWNRDAWHYFMGAYTFSANPPFNITKISSVPIITDGFYTQSNYYKRVIFPGGFVVDGDKIHVAYGKDDCEVWIATLDKTELIKSLQTVTPQD